MAANFIIGPRFLSRSPHLERPTPLIIVPTVIGITIDFVAVNRIRALLWMAVINGFVAARMLVVIMLIVNNERIMGRRG